MMISSIKLLKLLGALKHAMVYEKSRSFTTDGTHCYDSAIRAYNEAIAAIVGEEQHVLRRFPRLPWQLRYNIKRACVAALNALKRGDPRRVREILEKIVERALV